MFDSLQKVILSQVLLGHVKWSSKGLKHQREYLSMHKVLSQEKMWRARDCGTQQLNIGK